jgi:hypothetical protein
MVSLGINSREGANILFICDVLSLAGKAARAGTS